MFAAGEPSNKSTGAVTLAGIRLWQANVARVYSPDEEDGQMCPICRKQFADSTSLAVCTTVCSHQMHHKCLKKCIEKQLKSDEAVAGYCPCCGEPLCAICLQGYDIWTTNCKSLMFGGSHNVHRHCLMEGIGCDDTRDFTCKVCLWPLKKSLLRPNGLGRDKPAPDDTQSLLSTIELGEQQQPLKFTPLYVDCNAKARSILRDIHPYHPLPAHTAEMFSNTLSAEARINTLRFKELAVKNKEPIPGFRGQLDAIERNVSDILTAQQVHRFSHLLWANLSYFIALSFEGQSSALACRVAYDVTTFLMSAAFHSLDTEMADEMMSDESMSDETMSDEIMADEMMADEALSYENFQALMEQKSADVNVTLMLRLVTFAGLVVAEICKTQE